MVAAFSHVASASVVILVFLVGNSLPVGGGGNFHFPWTGPKQSIHLGPNVGVRTLTAEKGGKVGEVYFCSSTPAGRLGSRWPATRRSSHADSTF